MASPPRGRMTARRTLEPVSENIAGSIRGRPDVSREASVPSFGSPAVRRLAWPVALRPRLATGVPLSGGVFLNEIQRGARWVPRSAHVWSGVPIFGNCVGLDLLCRIRSDVSERDTPCTFDMSVRFLTSLVRSQKASVVRNFLPVIWWCYWSSSAAFRAPTVAWLVIFNSDTVYVLNKRDYNHVRAVRGGSNLGSSQ